MNNNVIFKVWDMNGKKVRLTQKQYEHIVKFHPEVEEEVEKIKYVIADPDVIRVGKLPNTFLFYRLFLGMSVGDKYLVVVVKYLNGDGFVMTAYFTRDVRGEEKIIWRRKK